MKNIFSIIRYAIYLDIESFFYNGAFSDALGRHNFGTFYATDWDTIQSVYLAYQNSTGFPLGGFWGVNLYRDTPFQIQFLNQEQAFLEIFNGFTLWGKFPYNFGKSLSANHSLTYDLTFINRDVILENDLENVNIFLNPESGNEGSLNFSYSYLNKRVHKRNMFTPNQGYGLTTALKYVSKNLWGDFNYSRLKLDTYINNKLGPFSTYIRYRYETINGRPLSQDTLGIFNIPNFYLMGLATPGREYMSPRGYNDHRLGTRAFMATFEFRAPVIPINVLEAVKIVKLGMPTFAFITDIGNAWQPSRKTENMIITNGIEFRFSINIDNIPIFIFSYGLAQEIKDWDKGTQPNPYLQLTLINPF